MHNIVSMKIMGVYSEMPRLQDVYDGKVDLGNVDPVWLHDSDSRLFHMFFGDRMCGCGECEECLPPVEYTIWDGVGEWLKKQEE